MSRVSESTLVYFAKGRVHPWMSDQLIQGPVWAAGFCTLLSGSALKVSWLLPEQHLSFVRTGTWTENPPLLSKAPTDRDTTALKCANAC